MRTSAERLAWARGLCEKAQLRMTPAREKILGYLARQRMPVNLDTITEADEIRGLCDPTTVYRSLMLLNELNVVRQVSVRPKIRYFILNLSAETSAYLICRCCGAITELPPLRQAFDLERHVTTVTGYAEVYHELELYGVCPECQRTCGQGIPSNKLRVSL
jgi:Fur family ferric uptake transcriptional regulator